MATLETQAQAATFHGWKVVWASFMLAVFGWGLGFYGPPVFLKVLHEQRGWPIALIATAVTVHFLVGAFSGANMSALHRRFGATPITRTCAIAMGSGLILWATHPIPGVLHQLCTQHLLRDLEDAAQSYPGAIWPGQAAGALRGLIHAANTARAEGLAAVPDRDMAADLGLFRHAVSVGLSEVRPVPGAKSKQKPGRMLLECLRDREADVLRFLGDLRIPPTSNQAERDLRPSKTQQKISGRLRSETATRNRYAIRGYLDTARKHDADVMTAIRDALAGNPWMPPIPA
jgi:hypothetical protein